MNGDEVVEAYIQYPEGKKLPIKELRQFKRVNILQNQAEKVILKIPLNDLQKWETASNGLNLIKGKYHLFVGSNSEDQKLIVDFNVE
jgi:beta-glucosidase